VTVRTALPLFVALLLGATAGCGVPYVPEEELAADDVDSADVGDEVDLGEDLSELAAGSAATRHVYGTTPQGRDLVYFKLTPANPSGRKAFLTFAIHGFEDAWSQDGRALRSIAQAMVRYFGNNPEKLNGWTVYVVPTANPDGTFAGTNNWREGTAGAFGRCTSNARDPNRNVSVGTSKEQRKLKELFVQVRPTIAIDFHGWYNTYYGNTKIGGFFQRSFNASYEGKPARYCFVGSAGSMDCGSTLGGIFHGSSSIATDLFAEWATRVQGVPAALVEYPAPDFNLNGTFDAVWDAELGYRRMTKSTLSLMTSRTRVALTHLFASY
jgi:hypothetical protein